MSDLYRHSSRARRDAAETGAATGEERAAPEVAAGTGQLPLVPHLHDRGRGAGSGGDGTGGSASAGVVSGRRQRRTNLAARGEPMVWLTGGCVATAVLMIIGLLVLITWRGLTTFWPGPLVQLVTIDGRTILGEPSREDVLVEPTEDGGQRSVRRVLYKTGNYDLTGEDFTWIREDAVASRSRPEWGLVIERLAWGNAYGTLEAVIDDGERVESPAAWARFNELHSRMLELRERLERIEKHEVGRVSREQDEMRLTRRAAAREHGEDSQAYQQLLAEQEQREAELAARFAALGEQADEIRAEMAKYRVEVRAPGGQLIPENPARPDEPMLVGQVVRAYPANQLGFGGKLGVYLSRWWEYLSDDPREANAEGGVFPAIVGTVLLTFIMILFVVPLGVIAAIYLREYARQGLLVSIVRISVNNLAGVPSIVYGVFGLGFFCYGVGAWIDAGPPDPLTPRGWTTLLLVTLGLVGGAVALGLVTRRLNAEAIKIEGSRRARVVGLLSFLLWVGAAGAVFALVWQVPFFDGFYRERLPDPTVGKSAMIWASLTLAILTLPVVIVATEEALAAVPRSMREGSYACGASKWQTIRRIVLPRALPGIMTGMILAIARGAGEVAPLMLVGAVKLAPEMPIALDAPWFGSDRSFMHLGFHIYDLGFQSRNSEAAKGMVYTTTLLLILVVVVLNVAAIAVRSRLRRAYATGQF